MGGETLAALLFPRRKLKIGTTDILLIFLHQIPLIFITRKRAFWHGKEAHSRPGCKIALTSHDAGPLFAPSPTVTAVHARCTLAMQRSSGGARESWHAPRRAACLLCTGTKPGKQQVIEDGSWYTILAYWSTSGHLPALHLSAVA